MIIHAFNTYIHFQKFGHTDSYEAEHTTTTDTTTEHTTTTDTTTNAGAECNDSTRVDESSQVNIF